MSSLPQLTGLEVIAEEATDPQHGNPPHQRPLPGFMEYGFISIDKPPGPTSHEVVAWIKRILGVRKAGHSGTLDPSVTGILPIGLGEATKALGLLLLGPKEYLAVARLHSSVGESKLRQVLGEFTGDIYQRPPQRASVKRVTRVRTIHQLELLEKSGNLLLLRCLCQAGTYIRKLIYDMGEVLGPGATMVELRRTRVADITEAQNLTRLHDLLDAHQTYVEGNGEAKLRRLVRPIEEALTHVKTLVVRDSAVDALCHGAQLAVPGILKLSPDLKKGDVAGVYTLKGEIVSLGRAQMNADEIIRSSKGIALTTDRVIMKQSTYPRLWRTKAPSIAH